MSTHFHSHDNSTHINYPDKIEIHEHKSPTDESIRLMEEVHDKAIKNIIAKVKVEDNLINGECFFIDQPWNMHNVRVIFKFKINGNEFTVEKEVSRMKLGFDDEKEINIQTGILGSYAKAVMVWYALKYFTTVAYEQITGNKFPEEVLLKYIS